MAPTSECNLIYHLGILHEPPHRPGGADGGRVRRGGPAAPGHRPPLPGPELLAGAARGHRQGRLHEEEAGGARRARRVRRHMQR